MLSTAACSDFSYTQEYGKDTFCLDLNTEWGNHRTFYLIQPTTPREGVILATFWRKLRCGEVERSHRVPQEELGPGFSPSSTVLWACELITAVGI